jgi:hypothetical protein
MAQLKGPFYFLGSFGNIRSYYDKNLKRYILSTKGGATKELINNNPAFARTRENMNEFIACGKWSSQLRKSLVSISHLHQGAYFPEIVSLSKRLQKHDDQHLRGYRSIESSKASVELTLLNFNQLNPFDRVLSHPYEVTFSEDKKTVTLKLSGFRSFSCLNWPTRYEAYRIVLVIAQLPDYVWLEEEQRYGPIIRDMERLTVSAFSDWHQSSTNPEDICLTASFDQPALQQPGTTVIVAIGIEVKSNSTGSASYTPSGPGTMKIVECFVCNPD